MPCDSSYGSKGPIQTEVLGHADLYVVYLSSSPRLILKSGAVRGAPSGPESLKMSLVRSEASHVSISCRVATEGRCQYSLVEVEKKIQL